MSRCIPIVKLPQHGFFCRALTIHSEENCFSHPSPLESSFLQFSFLQFRSAPSTENLRSTVTNARLHAPFLHHPNKLLQGKACISILCSISVKHVQLSITCFSQEPSQLPFSSATHSLNHIHSKYSLTAWFLHIFVLLVLSMNDPLTTISEITH